MCCEFFKRILNPNEKWAKFGFDTVNGWISFVILDLHCVMFLRDLYVLCTISKDVKIS